jgi:hypothetical protein
MNFSLRTDRRSGRDTRACISAAGRTASDVRHTTIPLLAAQGDNLVLLVGAARSGTTWLARVLDSHPDLIHRHEPVMVIRDETLNACSAAFPKRYRSPSQTLLQIPTNESRSQIANRQDAKNEYQHENSESAEKRIARVAHLKFLVTPVFEL